MLLTIDAENGISEKGCIIEFDDDTITECPICHKSFAPDPLFAYVYKASDKAEIVDLCF